MSSSEPGTQAQEVGDMDNQLREDGTFRVPSLLTSPPPLLINDVEQPNCPVPEQVQGEHLARLAPMPALPVGGPLPHKSS